MAVMHNFQDISNNLMYTESVFDNKSKAIPLQAWTGPEGSRRLRLPDFKTVST
jgi:hypothetical protein